MNGDYVKKQTKFSIRQLLLLFLFQIAIQGQTNFQTLSLSDCLNYALNNNPDLKKAAISVEQSKEKVREVIGTGLPQIGVNGSIVNNLELPTQLLPGDFFGAPGTFQQVKFGTKYNFSLTGEINQLLFSGSFWVGLSAANQSNDYYQQNSILVEEETKYNVSKAYYQTLVVQEQINLLQYNQRLLLKSLSDTQLKYENGKVKQVDVDRIKVSLNNVLYQIKKGNESLEQAYNNLKYSMGMPVGLHISLSDSISMVQNSILKNSENDFINETAIDFSFDDRIDYKILQTNLSLLELDRKNQLVQFLPTISAFGNYTLSASRTSFDLFDKGKDWFKSYSIGLRIQLPIFSGGQRLAKINQASLEIEGMKETINKTENGINMQVSNAKLKYSTAYENTKINKMNAELANKVYESTLLEYKEGITNTVILVDAETKLREAQTNFINSLLELYVAKLDLEKSKGTLLTYLNKIANNN